MGNVISIAAKRTEKFKEAMALWARNRQTVVIQTRTGQIVVQRMTCRERFAEILNSAGDFAIVDYADIRSIRPATVEQTSVVNARGEFLPAPEASARVVPILHFEPRKRRVR